MPDYLVQTPAQLPLHLKSLREIAGLTQAQVAQKLGVGQARYAQIEKDPEAVSTRQLCKVLAVLGVDMLLRPRKGRKMPPLPRKGEDW